MSRSSYLAFAFVTFIAAASATAQVNGNPVTISELTNRMAELKRADMDAKLDEVRRKANPGTPTQIARTCEDDLIMTAVYGMGNKLRADFGFRGTTVALSPGDKTEVGGWHLQELTSTRALMAKRGAAGKNGTQCPVYLSTASQTPMINPSVPGHGGGGVNMNVTVPPIVPVSGSTTVASSATAADKASSTGK